MKNLYLALATCLLFTGSPLSAHNRTLAQSFTRTLPAAVSEGLLIDTPIAMLLWGLGLDPVSNIPLAAVMATSGYAIRKTCKDYFEVEKSDWKRAALCGFAGGSFKYSAKAVATGDISYVEPILGAVDAGTYEGTAWVRGQYDAAEFAAIEGAVAALCYVLRPLGSNPTSLWSEVKIGMTTGVLVAATLKTTLATYEASVANWVERFTQWWEPTPDSQPKTEL